MAQFRNCFVYARFSSKGQRHGTSVERQIGDGLQHSQAKGWPMPSNIIDDGRSAFHGKHRDGGKLGDFEAEALAGEHPNTVFIVEKLDRLERGGAQTTMNFITSMMQAGVSIATIDGDQLYRAGEKLDLTQLMMMVLKAEVAFEESAKKSDRQKSNWQIKRRKFLEHGVPITRNCACWLEVIDGKYVVRDEIVPIIIRMLQMADAGMGVQTIVGVLEGEGVKPIFKGAKVWHKGQVGKLLKDRKLLGEYPTPEGPKKLLTAVVPADLFERVQANAPARKAASVGNGKGKGKVRNLFSGFCRCDTCNGRMEYVGSGKGYLRCRNALSNRCDNRTSVPYRPLETLLLDRCLHLAMDENAFTNKAEVARLNGTIAERERDLKVLTDQAERLWLSAVGADASPMAEKVARKVEAEANAVAVNLKALRQQREAAKGRASSLEHMQRIADIRSKLDADKTLRGRVAQGFAGLITQMWFHTDKTVTVMMAGGMAALRIVDGQVEKEANMAAVVNDTNISRLQFAGERDRKGAPAVLKRLKRSL